MGPVLDSQKEYMKTLNKMIENFSLSNVHFLGFRKEIPELLRDSNIYICSSNFESSPIAVWEAMVAGKFIITTNVGDTEFIIQNNDVGRVIPIQDTIAMKNAILEAVKNPHRDVIAKKGQRIASSLFDAGSIAQQIYHLLKATINSDVPTST